MSPAKILALPLVVLCLSLCGNAFAMKATVSAKSAFLKELHCGQPGHAAGGYSPVKLPSSEVSTAATLALKSFTAAHKELAKTCPPPPHPKPNTSIIAACSQVVAGTNYGVLFNATLPCAKPAGSKLELTLSAIVAVPLPFMNKAPVVVSVKRVN